MARRLRFVPVLVLLLSWVDPSQLAAQNNSGLLGAPYPPSYRWNTLSTPHNRLIFPEGYGEEALRIASLTSTVHGPLMRDYKLELPPYPIVLNTSADIANGWFGLAPRMSQWYAFPSQERFAGPVDWYTLLALHEGRHAVQFSALDRGFIRVAHILAGEYGWSFFSMYSVPLWFWEGDAILAETAFTTGGRGRSAAFHRELMALAAEEEQPSYQQAYLGSFQTHFPDHYALGYPLVSYIRLTYGDGVWSEILEKTAKWAFVPLRFHGVVKSVTGRSVRDLYGEMLGFMDGYRREQRGGDGKGFPPLEYLTEETEDWINYLPVALEKKGRAQVYAVRFGDVVPTELVRVRTTGETEVITPFRGKNLLVDIDVRSKSAVWAETVPHPLWTEVSKGRLVIYDMEKDLRRDLPGQGHFQAPVFSPEGSRIAAIEVSPSGTGSLVIFARSDGKRLESSSPRLPVAGREGIDLLHPAWSEDGERIAVVAIKSGRSFLLEYSPGTGGGSGSWKVVVDSVDEQLTHPAYAGNYLLHGSDFTGSEGIYAVERKTGRRYQVVERPFGAVRPIPDVVTEEDRLVFADYGVSGFRLAEMELDEKQFVPLSELDRIKIAYADPLFEKMGASGTVGAVQRASCVPDGESAPELTVAGTIGKHGTNREAVTRYRPAAHLLNFHSWGLYPSGDGRLELFVQSDDPLGIMSLQPYGGFDYPANRYYTGFRGSYRGIFPVLRYGASGDVYHPGDQGREFYGFTGSLGLDAPINFSRGTRQRRLTFSATCFLRVEEPDPIEPGDEEEAVMMPIALSAGFYNGEGSLSPADLALAPSQYSRWSWYEVPLREEYRGRRLEQRGYLLFPGFFRHHILKMKLEGRWEGGAEIPLNLVPIRPHGYAPEWSKGYTLAGVAGIEYSLPLIAPDLTLGNFYYLKRVVCSFFHHAGYAFEEGLIIPRGGENELFRSSGVELIFQQNLFSWPVTFEGGVRLIYRWRDRAVRVEDTVFTLGIEW